MVDTVILSFAEGGYRLMDEKRFQPGLAAKLRHPGVKAGDKHVQNPTTQELLAGNYKPRLTFTARPHLGAMAIFLKVEFSAPKLLFGNNFEELTDADFDPLIDKLRTKLQEMGIEVFSASLSACQPTGVHYSKNFVFRDFTTSSVIIDELSRADVTKRLDIARSKYRNEGHGLAWHADSYEVVFYDKVKDLEQTKIGIKRAFDRENQLQLPLLDFIQASKPKPFEVLRFEVRLPKRKLNSLLKKLGYKENLSFRELFSSRLSLAVLNDLWLLATTGLELVLPKIDDPLSHYQNLRILNPNIKPDKLLKLAYCLLILSKDGFRKLRDNYEGKQGNWAKLKKELAELKLPTSSYRPYQIVTEALKKYEPVKFKDYPDVFEKELIINDKERYSGKNERKPISAYDYD